MNDRVKAAIAAAALATVAILASVGLSTIEGIDPHWWIYVIGWVPAWLILWWELRDLRRPNPASRVGDDTEETT